MNPKDVLRVTSKFAIGDGCWEWTASRNIKRGGYGQIKMGGRVRKAHQVVYELLVGPIPAGTVLDHLCRTPACVRPDHLEPVSTRTNVLRGVAPSAIHAQQTHCVRGHELDETGIARYQSYGKGRGRICLLCRKIRNDARPRSAK